MVQLRIRIIIWKTVGDGEGKAWKDNGIWEKYGYNNLH